MTEPTTQDFDWSAPLPGEGITLIEASAGTGKTFTIEGLCLRLVLETGLNIEQVLVVTYTNAAAANLRRRLRQRFSAAAAELNENRIQDPALLPFANASIEERIRLSDTLAQAFTRIDEATIATIHGFCQKVLRETALLAGGLADFEVAPDPSFNREQRIEDYRGRNFLQGRPWLGTLLFAKNDWRTRLNNLDALSLFAGGSRLLPDNTFTSLDAAEAAVQAAFAAAKEGWQADDVALGDLLRNHDALSTDQRNWVGSRNETVDTLEALFTSGAPSHAALAALACVSEEAIERSILKRKRAQWPGHGWFRVVTALQETMRRAEATLWRDFVEQMKQAQHEGLLLRAERTYDELLLGVAASVRGTRGGAVMEALHKQFHCVLIDEFQDTDPLQWELFERIFGRAACRLFLVGDPKQAIYSFRGADIFTYLKARKATQQRFTLTTNYRSQAALIETVNALFSASTAPFVFPEITFQPVASGASAEAQAGASLECWLHGLEVKKELTVTAATERVIALTTAQISRLHKEHPDIPLDHYAVLVRTNRQAQAVAQRLRANSLPARLFSTGNVLDTDEASWLYWLMRAVAELNRDEFLRTCLATPLFNWAAQSIHELNTNLELQTDIAQKFQQWNETWKQRGFLAFFVAFEESESAYARLIQRNQGEDSVSCLRHLVELIRIGESQGKLSPAGLCDWFARLISEKKTSDDERFARPFESETAGVQVLTTHKSKGLEYEFVLCPFVWQPPKEPAFPLRAHDPNEPGLCDVYLGEVKTAPTALRSRAEAEIASEDARLLYVALTRARRRCLLHWANTKGAKNAALARLAPEGKDLEGWLQSLADEHLAAISTKCAESFPVPRHALLSNESENVTQVEVRPWNRKLVARPMTSSFSSLVSQAGSPAADHEDLPVLSNEAATEATPTQFRAGAATGRLFHEIFERIDFSDTSTFSQVVVDRLNAHGLPTVGPPFEAALQWVERTVATPLTQVSHGFSLSKLRRGDCRAEVEFSLPARWGNGQQLSLGLEQLGLLGSGQHPANAVAAVNGYLRGFIDLLFQHEGRYYILDWKTNLLDDASEDGLRKAMHRASYRLQAYLYALAAARYLGTHAKLGGMLYLFVRAIAEHSTSEPAEGVYFEKPDPAILVALANLLGMEP